MGFPTFRHTAFFREDILINNIVAFTRNFPINIKFSFCLGASKCCGCIFFRLTFRSFWLCLIVFASMICLKDVFLRKSMTGAALNTSPNILLFNIWQCLLIISLIFGKIGLYVNENGITFVCTELVLFNRADPSRLSTFSIWFRKIFSLYHFSINCLTKSLEYFL